MESYVNSLFDSGFFGCSGCDSDIIRQASVDSGFADTLGDTSFSIQDSDEEDVSEEDFKDACDYDEWVYSMIQLLV